MLKEIPDVKSIHMVLSDLCIALSISRVLKVCGWDMLQ